MPRENVVHVEAGHSHEYVTPNKVYQMDLRADSSYLFKHAAPHNCQYGFVCPVLDGNICGDYKVWIGSADVCQPNVVHEGTLSQDGEVSARRSDGGSGYARCNFWCTPDGDLPSNSTSEEATVALLSELEKRLGQVQNRSLAPSPHNAMDEEDSDKLEVLSPIRIYRVVQKDQD